MSANDLDPNDSGNLQFHDNSKHLIKGPSDCEENPCTDAPEMLLTVTGSSGTINWCGQTWDLPDDSGEEKSVCPTSYIQTRRTQDLTTRFWFLATNVWRYTNSLNLGRVYNAFQASPSFTGYWYRGTGTPYGLDYNKLWFEHSGIPQQRDYVSFRNGFGVTAQPVAPTSTNVNNSTLGLIVPEPPAYYSDYLITDGFFGSHVVAGITYTWTKGQGWP